MTEPQSDAIGTVVAIWRYPVKSMMGEELNAADITARGMEGDRAYAVIDLATGKVASAKHPKKWGRLFDCRAQRGYDPHADQAFRPVQVIFPDGRMMRVGDGDLDENLSTLLGRNVCLTGTVPGNVKLEEYWPEIPGRARQNAVTDETMPAGTFFDGALIHLMTTTTLDALRAEYPAGRFEVRRFRPNLVVTSMTEETGCVENAWVGRTVKIGKDLMLKVTGLCARCVMTTLPQGDLPEDPGILRTAVRYNRSAVGVYATVVQPGRVNRGDQIRFS